MKYGSQGFNLFGYKGSCNFSLGTYDDALASPDAARYLCEESQALERVCLNDYSGEGICYSSDLWDGFYRASPVCGHAFYCLNIFFTIFRTVYLRRILLTFRTHS